MKPIPFNAFAKLLGGNDSSQSLIHGAAIDSRLVKEGDLFFALPGAKADGHFFIQEAVKRGAAGFVVKNDYQGETFGLPSLRVPDVLAALQEFARKTLQKRSCQVVGITGSLGKTTTKEFAKTLISGHLRVFANPLSYNSQSTLPLSILMANGEEDVLILEMGMSEPGNIQNLLSIAPPDIAVLTTVALQHVTHFSDGLAGIAREKASIFAHPKTRLGILHRDMPYFEEASYSGSCLKKSFSIANQAADYFLEIFPRHVLIHVQGEPCCAVSVQFPLKPYYQNFLAAVAIARALDVPWEMIKKKAAFLKQPKMRFEFIEKNGILFVNDAYNANPDSMQAALTSLPQAASGRKKIAVLGDMDALGTFSEERHAQVIKTALQHVDVLLCLGSRWGHEVEQFNNCSELEERLQQIVQPGDVVLLKGARAHALEKVLRKFD